MKVDVRSRGLSGAQTRELAATVRTAFRDLAHRIACVVVSVSLQAEKKHAARNCVVEVHMADGHVELVEERQRRLGAALRRAVQRAWKAAVRSLARQLPARHSTEGS
jgi:hypothetical protein